MSAWPAELARRFLETAPSPSDRAHIIAARASLKTAAAALAAGDLLHAEVYAADAAENIRTARRQQRGK